MRCGSPMKTIDELRQTTEGMATLQSWLGEDGHPVPIELANERASVCVDMCCLENRAPNWWQTFSTDPIARVIRWQLEIKNSVRMRVDLEDSIHMCRACGCCLKLKVHVPICHIEQHINKEQLEQFPDYCWIKKEIKQ